MLGNLTPNQMKERLGVTFTEDEIKWLESTRQNKAEDIAAGKWHCFDLPFRIVTGDEEMGVKVRDMLMPYSNKMICAISIGWER